MNRLILLVGYPASGKTTFINNIRYASQSVILCPDDFRMELTGQEFYAPAEEYVWATVKLSARVLLKTDYTVVIDATHLTRGSRAQWIRIANNLNKECCAYWFQTPYEVCCARNKARTRVVPDDVMQRMMEGFEPPTTDEGLSEIVPVLYH